MILGALPIASGSRLTAGGSMNPYNPLPAPPAMLPYLPGGTSICPPGTIDAGVGHCVPLNVDGGDTTMTPPPGAGPVNTGIPFTYLIAGAVLLFLVLR